VSGFPSPIAVLARWPPYRGLGQHVLHLAVSNEGQSLLSCRWTPGATPWTRVIVLLFPGFSKRLKGLSQLLRGFPPPGSRDLQKAYPEVATFSHVNNSGDLFRRVLYRGEGCVWYASS